MDEQRPGQRKQNEAGLQSRAEDKAAGEVEKPTKRSTVVRSGRCTRGVQPAHLNLRPSDSTPGYINVFYLQFSKIVFIFYCT